MSISQIISIIWALGLGSLIGVLLTVFSERNLSNKKMLFEARVKAYSWITGRVFNMFLEPDITNSKGDELVWVKLNQLLSEAMLMAGHDLCNLIWDYKIKIFEFHCALREKKSDNELKVIHEALMEISQKIHVGMRKELHIDNKSVFN